MAIGECEHCQTPVTYPVIFCDPCKADHRQCEHGFWCEEPGEHRALLIRKGALPAPPLTGPLEYTVVDEAANIDWTALETSIARLGAFLLHAATCPCTHCAHLRANSSTPHGEGASGPAPTSGEGARE